MFYNRVNRKNDFDVVNGGVLNIQKLLVDCTGKHNALMDASVSKCVNKHACISSDNSRTNLNMSSVFADCRVLEGAALSH